jgi:transposase
MKQSNDSVKFIGVDVSKDTLELFSQSLKVPTQIQNTPKAIASWLKVLGPHRAQLHIVCESTGGYENTLLRACWKVGVRVSRLNPARVRDFARCRGLLAKTDAIDAKTIAEFASAFPPEATPQPSPQQVLLTELIARREDLKTQRAAESNRSRDIQDKSLRRMLDKHLQFLDAQIKKIDQLIEDTISQDQDMSRKRDILTQTKGVGKTSAAILLSCLPELGTLSGASISALAGVAPFNRDSGTLRGKRCIRAGRATARKALYMCALVASRTNDILKTIYQRLVSKGKPPKVALTALMRKLVVHLNSSLKNLNSQPA